MSAFFVYSRGTTEHTEVFESFAEPSQPDNNYNDIDKAQIRDDGSDVDEDLLVSLERLHIDTASISAAIRPLASQLTC